MSNNFLKRFAPRWIIFCCDIVLISFSFIFSFFLVEHLSVNFKGLKVFLPGLITNLAISLICFAVFAIYKGIIRYSEIRDIVRVIKFAFLQFVLWTIVSFVDTNHYVSGTVSLSLLLINLFAVIDYFQFSFAKKWTKMTNDLQ